jgi:hypothetical protein
MSQKKMKLTNDQTRPAARLGSGRTTPSTRSASAVKTMPLIAP